MSINSYISNWKIYRSKCLKISYVDDALDTKTGNLVFGWYDGRNDPTFESLAAVIHSKVLDELVEAIPLSNPIYTIPPSSPQSIKELKVNASKPLTEKEIKTLREIFRKKRIIKK